jgi:hypothetical protein
MFVLSVQTPYIVTRRHLSCRSRTATLITIIPIITPAHPEANRISVLQHDVKSREKQMTNKQCNFASNNNIHFFSEKSAAKFGIVFIIFLVWIKNIIMYSKVL